MHKSSLQKRALAVAIGSINCAFVLTPLLATAQDSPRSPESPSTSQSRLNASQAPSNDASELSTVTVIGEAVREATTEGSNSFTTDRSTIGLSEQAIKNIPQSVSVLTRERLNDQNLTSLKEAMEQTTGISVMSYGSNQYQLRSRGYDIDSLMLDGSRVEAPYGSLSNTGLYDTALYDRIEVMRGPTGILTGSGEPSGTVNLARKRARRDFGFDMSLSAGSWDAYRSTIDVTGSLNENGSLRGRIVGVYDEQESFVDEVNAQNAIGYGTLEYDFTPDTTLSVGVARQTEDSRPHSGLPVASNGNLFDVDRSTYLGSSWDRSHANATRYFADLEHYLNNGGFFSLKANQIEPPRLFRRPVCLSQAASPDSSK